MIVKICCFSLPYVIIIENLSILNIWSDKNGGKKIIILSFTGGHLNFWLFPDIL